MDKLIANPQRRVQLGRGVAIVWSSNDTEGKRGWVLTPTFCQNPECDCVTVHTGVVGVDDGLHSAWRDDEGVRLQRYEDSTLEPGFAASLDLRRGTVELVSGPRRDDDDDDDDETDTAAASGPLLRELERDIDGPVLDELWRYAWRAKRRRTDWLVSQPPEHWVRGELVAWSDVAPGSRPEAVIVDGVEVKIEPFVCPLPDCNCRRAVLTCYVEPEAGRVEPQHIGEVIVAFDGAAPKLTPETPADEGSLQQAWAQYVRRWPQTVEHLAGLYTTVRRQLRSRLRKMEQRGMDRLAEPPAEPAQTKAQTKVFRNRPCPCGSGKKYKRCCSPRYG
jgi:hypothetical protein